MLTGDARLIRSCVESSFIRVQESRVCVARGKVQSRIHFETDRSVVCRAHDLLRLQE